MASQAEPGPGSARLATYLSFFHGHSTSCVETRWVSSSQEHEQVLATLINIWLALSAVTRHCLLVSPYVRPCLLALALASTLALALGNRGSNSRCSPNGYQGKSDIRSYMLGLVTQ